MAIITVTGTIKDSNNQLASSGSVYFMLSGYMINTSNFIVNAREVIATVSASGTISVSLESTLDASPGTRYYRVRFVGVINGRAVAQDLGTITIAATPSSQNLATLITTALPPSTAAAAFYDETPTGTVDASNKTFTLTATPKAGTLKLFLNGILQLEGTDYTRSTNTITMTIPPFVGQWLFASYRTA